MSSVTASGPSPAVALAAVGAAQSTHKAAQGLRPLRGEREFRKVRQHGAVVRCALFTLRVTAYRPRYGEVWQPQAIVGIVVPKKTLRHAVKRNRVRRRIREALRTLPALPACRATLHPTPQALGVPFAQLQAELQQALLRGLSAPAKKSGNKTGNKAGKGAAGQGGAQGRGPRPPAQQEQG